MPHYLMFVPVPSFPASLTSIPHPSSSTTPRPSSSPWSSPHHRCHDLFGRILYRQSQCPCFRRLCRRSPYPCRHRRFHTHPHPQVHQHQHQFHLQFLLSSRPRAQLAHINSVVPLVCRNVVGLEWMASHFVAGSTFRKHRYGLLLSFQEAYIRLRLCLQLDP